MDRRGVGGAVKLKLFSPVVLYAPSEIIIRHETRKNVDFLKYFLERKKSHYVER